VVSLKGSSMERVISVSAAITRYCGQCVIIINWWSTINWLSNDQLAPDGTAYKYLADQWRADPSLLFSTREQCVEEVRKGNRVYPEVSEFLFFFFFF
jgi:hypothetical protein